MLNNSRVRYFILILVVIALGITSRKLEGIPTFFGDSLYAVMVYFGLRMFFINLKSQKTTILALLFCFGIEFLQLYDGEWMLEIRRTTLGHYVLGQGFIASDLVYYTLGIFAAVYLDFKFIARK
jgi:glycopeptide antibiotics resistance protein